MKHIEGVIFVATFALLSCNAQFWGRRLRGDEPCEEPGFFRDTHDCTKFYRCADHKTNIQGITHIIKYEFSCPAGTIFDEAITTCNHYDMVSNRPAECQRPVVHYPSQSVDQQEQSPPPSAIRNTWINFQPNPLFQPIRPTNSFYTDTITIPNLHYIQGARGVNYI